MAESIDISDRPLSRRPGFGTSGKRVSLVTNHFKISFRKIGNTFYQYHVSIMYGDNRPVDSELVSRKVIDKLCQIYTVEISGEMIIYDGGKSMYTVEPLQLNTFEFTVVLEESFSRRSQSPSRNGSIRDFSKRFKCSLQTTTFMVNISYAAKIPLQCIDVSLQESEPNKVQDSTRALNTLLRQQAAKRGCLLVRQSFFDNDSRMFTDVGGGVTAVKGLHSSFHPTFDGLTLNIDVSTTMIVTPGPIVDFLLANQNVKAAHFIDWMKAKKMLKNLRVKASHTNMEFKILGLSDKPCHQQTFLLKVKSAGTAVDGEVSEISVYDYFVNHHNIELRSSAHMPCLDVGKPQKPIYLPIELCSLLSIQRYKRPLSMVQRQSLVDKSRQKPLERIQVITDAIRNCCYHEDPVLTACGVSIEKQLIQLDGRVLDAPTLKVGGGEDCIPRNGRWNVNNKQLLDPCCIECWALVSFSTRCDTSHLSRELISCGRKRGIHMERPYTIIEEDPQYRSCSPVIRVEKMFEQIFAKLPGPPEFLLCVLQERKNSAVYGPWKKKCLTDIGIVSQCISPIKIDDQYLTNVLLKINSKLGGINSLLEIEHSCKIPRVTDKPTMIIGMDVSHGPPGCPDVPSFAAVVGSQSWPLISRYRAAVRMQSSRVEMIESLFKPLENGEDDGIMRELLLDFYKTSNGRKPTQVIVFRDGVSESQFDQVINIELDQMVKAYRHLGESNIPEFTVIVVQKNHHTRLFQASGFENVSPGTVVDTKIVHPRNYDFYICPQAGRIGTSRPARYQVLIDEIGFSPDDLQNLIHCLSYINQRSTVATSIVAPVSYAHLAAYQVGQFMKFDDLPSDQTEGKIILPQLPRLHKDVAGTMFFC